MSAPLERAHQGDPFNCPSCGAHDFGLYSTLGLEKCPRCVDDERKHYQELLWRLYEGIYGHRKAENIDPFSTAVGGALEVNKAWNERGRQPAEDSYRKAITEATQCAMDMPLKCEHERHSYRWTDTYKAAAWDIAHAIRKLARP